MLVVDKDYDKWMESKEVIKTMLRQLRPDMTEEVHDHNAAAIIARLANHRPPLLICYPSEMKGGKLKDDYQ